VKSSCECDDEPSGCINAGKFLSDLSGSVQLHIVSWFTYTCMLSIFYVL
jgi:hypothetical protein